MITNLGKQRSKYFKWRDPATDLHLFSKLKILNPSRLWFQGPARVPKSYKKYVSLIAKELVKTGKKHISTNNVMSNIG